MLSTGKIVPPTDRLSTLSEPALLLHQICREYEALLVALHLEIKPKGEVEQVYLEDLTAIAWEIQRLRRCKAGIINNAFRSASQKLCCEAGLLLSPSILSIKITARSEAADSTKGWFISKRCKKPVIRWQYSIDMILTRPPLKPRRSGSHGRISN